MYTALLCVKPNLTNPWWMCRWSAVKGEIPRDSLTIIILVVSTNGIIIAHRAASIELLNLIGSVGLNVWFEFTNWIVIMDRSVPITSEPVSPMKMLDGSQF